MDKAHYGRLCALVVDDNRHMRSLLRSLLYALGVRNIHEACDGKEGYEVLAAQRPDLVITDYSMSPINGTEFTRMVRKLEGRLGAVPIVMVSGHSELRFVEEARDSGVSEFLCKPITVRDLELRLDDIFERPRFFVRAYGFVGPDRRRRKGGYAGPERRNVVYL
jgi:two-component system, chemotaxis family, chemotaxis protein CheY